MLELLIDQPIFIGFKADSSLRRQIEALSGPDKTYISADDSTLMRICRVGEDVYVGKLIHERLTTERVDDVRRNILSILHRLVRDVRLPEDFEIVACSATETGCVPGGQVA